MDKEDVFSKVSFEPELSDCRGLPASGCVAADTRKMSFRYSQLCRTASDTVDVVRSAIPKGFKFKNIKLYNSLK